MANVIRIHEHGTPSVMRLETEDIRAPARGEVFLRQEAIGVNYVDIMVRDGRFGVRLPVVLGFEGGGCRREPGSRRQRVFHRRPRRIFLLGGRVRVRARDRCERARGPPA